MMPISCVVLFQPSIDKVKKQCHLIYRIEGAGTAIFSTSQGDTLDVMGPQGNGFDLSDLDEQSQILLVGGDWCTSFT